MINASWFWLFICSLFYFFFLKKAENNRFRKSQLAKIFLIYVIFLPLLKVGLVGLVDQQINFALP